MKKTFNGAIAPQASFQEALLNRVASWLDARHEFFQFEKKPSTHQLLHFLHVMAALFALVLVAGNLFGTITAFVWLVYAFSLCKKGCNA